MKEEFFVYILTNKKSSVFYTGRTKNLKQRIYLHKGKWKQSFTRKYNATKLVYFENYPTLKESQEREKKIKLLSRKNKIKLIEKLNPQWNDLLSQNDPLGPVGASG